MPLERIGAGREVAAVRGGVAAPTRGWRVAGMARPVGLGVILASQSG